MEVMDGRLEGLHKRFLVNSSQPFLEIVGQVGGISVTNETSDMPTSHPAAVISDNVRVRVTGKHFQNLSLLS
jgi:hypothetical protein